MNNIIFVVEDNQDISEIIEYLLQDFGYNIITCSTAGAFHEQIIRSRPRLVILDVMLPDGNGIDICNQIKTSTDNRDIPVILMSAHAESTTVAKECKADDFIAKPFDIHDFARRVQIQVAS